ncbi:hypothetical protein Tco_0414810, partial [Tanacetum coccineum]
MSKAAITPMETKLPLTKDEEAFDVDVHLYRSMIGSLMYLTASRPDIMYAVCVCSRFQHSLIETMVVPTLDRKSTKVNIGIQGLDTPPTTKVNTSREEQVEEISPNTLEAAKTLSKVASLKSRSIDKGRRYKRRKETKGKKVVSSLDFQEGTDVGAEQVNTPSAEQVNTASGVNTGSIKQVNTPSAEQVNTASGVNTGSIKHSTGDEQLSTSDEKVSAVGQDKGQREGKAPMISEETPKKSKEQILQEEASLAEAIRLDSLQKEEEAKQIHLDSLLA